jgi:NADP-dependent 3-hydroxy acid dehydrogenase YdfG
VLYATHVFVDDLCAGGGDVVNLSSVAGRIARPASNVYAATKHAVTGWSDALRQELLACDVRVICIEPGAVSTELPYHITDPQTRKDADTFYGGAIEILSAEDIAAMICTPSRRPSVSRSARCWYGRSGSHRVRALLAARHARCVCASHIERRS